jgi:DNA-binding NarL/FixJ family response regulator
MDNNVFRLGIGGISPRGQVAGFVPPLQAAPVESGAAPIRVLLGHAHGLFGQGLAALLAAEPDVELLARVTDGEAAWELIRSREPDVALLDLALARVPGIEIARRVRAEGLATRCLALALAPDPVIASQALHAGMAGYLLKDSGFDELMLALRSIEAGQVFVSAPIAARLRRQRGEAPGAAPLSPREREVVRLVAAGHSSKMIARVLAISPQTVDTHRRRLMRKLDLHSATEVVRYAVQSGLVG